MNKYEYLIDKVNEAKFESAPFKHIYIENFFSDDDFKEITLAEDNNIPIASDDDGLFDNLIAGGYKVIEFPGCITDIHAYKQWRMGNKHVNHTACEGLGMTLRLEKAKSKVLDKLQKFITGKVFNKVLAEKFDIDISSCNVDGGIQKYLDGYEISPHPDIRRKALTFMVNINPHKNSEELDHHTRYCKLTPSRKYVKSLWKGNSNIERCWVPWDWCDVVKQQYSNNSIVIFSPNDETMHAVKASYDHLNGQRTQLYGNLWYKDYDKKIKREWEDLDIITTRFKTKEEKTLIKDIIKKVLPDSLLNKLKSQQVLKRNID